MPPKFVCFLVALAVAVPAGSQEPPTDSRAALLAALERLMITGEPHDTSFDDGQLLQLSVDDAIRNGDTEVERAAIRAAAPLFAIADRPLIEVGQPLSVGVSARPILKVPRPVAFKAAIYVSVDGRDYGEAGTLASGKDSRVVAKIPEDALTVGPHHIRIRARMAFSGPPLQSWTEERQLPDVTYAVYDSRSPETGPAPLLLAPRAINASVLDQNLPDVPVGKWLASILERAEAKPVIDWIPQYCVERKQRTVAPPIGGGDLCAVAYFATKSDIFRAWFRTGSVRLTDAAPVWKVDQPSFEGIDTSGSGTALTTLSALPALLDTPRESWPTADLSIAPTDITVETPRPDWAIVTVTVHNNGAVAVYRARVTVAAGIDPESRAIPSRNLTVDVPGNGSSEIKVGTRLPGPYGFVFAHATQISDMSPHDTFTFDPTPEDACAFRLINARLAPAEYLSTIARLSGPCAGW